MSNGNRVDEILAVSLGTTAVACIFAMTTIAWHGRQVPAELVAVSAGVAGALGGALRANERKGGNGNGTHGKPPTHPTA